MCCKEKKQPMLVAVALPEPALAFLTILIEIHNYTQDVGRPFRKAEKCLTKMHASM